MSEFRDWYDGIPFFTRWWLTLSVIFSLAGRFGLIDPLHLYLFFDPIVNSFQIWRPLTALFYYPPSFHFLLNCYFLYNYSLRLETSVFAGRPADYCTLLLFSWLCCLLGAFVGGLRLLMDPMVMSVLYVWCQLNKDVVVTFWFGTRFKAMYLPWVLFAIDVIIYGGGIMELLGILVGHLSFFLMFKYPQDFGGAALLTTPDCLRSLFPDSRVMGGFGSAPTPRPDLAAGGTAAAGGGIFSRGYNWGRGQTLGGN